MIDTVVILIRESRFKIFKPELFFPSADKLLNPSYYMGGSYARATQNPSKHELKKGKYKPRLTLTKRYKGIQQYEVTLKVEYSVPKLFFGNNFDELSQHDIPDATEKLRSVLNQMGVYTTINDIENARIGAIHYSKNIALTDYTSTSMYLQELSKVNMNMKLDVNQTDFRNGGHSLKYRTNKREIVFYDKLKDLQQAKISEKRSEETDNAIQLNLFDERKVPRILEILRIEIRLGDMKNIRKSLHDARIDRDLNYKSLCNEDVAKAIVHTYWFDMRNRYVPALGASSLDQEDYLVMLIRNNPYVTKGKILTYVGIKSLIDRIGMRDLRVLLQGLGYSGWYRLIKGMNELKVTDDLGLIQKLNDKIINFTPIRLVDFEGGMLNNDKHVKQ